MYVADISIKSNQCVNYNYNNIKLKNRIEGECKTCIKEIGYHY